MISTTAAALVALLASDGETVVWTGEVFVDAAASDEEWEAVYFRLRAEDGSTEWRSADLLGQLGDDEVEALRG